MQDQLTGQKTAESLSRRAIWLLAAILLVLSPGLGAAGDAPPAASEPPAPGGAVASPADPSITYVSAGGVVPAGLPVDPLASLYLWRAPASGESRLRAQISVIVNEVRWDRRVSPGQGWQTVLALDSVTFPWEQPEVVEGREYRPGELKWYQARVGAGFGWHGPLGRGETFNGLDAALTLEGGALWFQRGSETAPAYVLPVDTFEGRLHLRVRADALSRNDVLIPTRGWSAGLDGNWGVRNRWEPWGDPATGLVTGGRGWVAASGFAYGVVQLPGLSGGQVLVGSLHAGIGSGLDRFSSLRLGGGSNWGDHETLSHPILPAAAMDEIATSRYAMADLEYRVRVVSLLFLQARGTLAWADVPVQFAGGFEKKTPAFPAVTLGLTTGLPWDLALEASWSWNFGLETAGDVEPTKGRSGLTALLVKSF